MLAEVHQLEVERVELLRRMEDAETRSRDVQRSILETEQQLDELRRENDVETARHAELDARCDISLLILA